MIYTTTIFAFMPDSRLAAYLRTADRLLAALDCLREHQIPLAVRPEIRLPLP